MEIENWRVSSKERPVFIANRGTRRPPLPARQPYYFSLPLASHAKGISYCPSGQSNSHLGHFRLTALVNKYSLSISLIPVHLHVRCSPKLEVIFIYPFNRLGQPSRTTVDTLSPSGMGTDRHQELEPPQTQNDLPFSSRPIPVEHASFSSLRSSPAYASSAKSRNALTCRWKTREKPHWYFI